jgi:hypothetical protein
LSLLFFFLAMPAIASTCVQLDLAVQVLFGDQGAGKKTM